jgi:hypothetical protein
VSRPASDALPSRRLRREKRTVEVMMAMYCRDRHASSNGGAGPSRPGLCPSCTALLDYTSGHIDACRFGDAKPTCASCTVHCFRAGEREGIRQVMRYSGPRMITRHPYLAVRHLLDRHHTPEPAA